VPQPVYDDLLALATDAAAQAAGLLLDGLGHARTDVSTKSSRTDMVTEMDRASEALIVKALLSARPDDGVVGEEGSARTGTSGVRWVIDPLDGTTNYLYGHPGWSVSIAAEVELADATDATDAQGGGDPAASRAVVAGVVLDAMHAETFSATRGGGARRNGEPIHCSDQDDVSRALVATGFGYAPERRVAQAEVLSRVIGDIRDIRRMGAASVDLCWVGCGRLDAYFERGLSWWDLAAGSLVAAEAGAVVTSLAGGPVEAGSIVASAPRLATPLRALLSSHGVEKVP
jgi:myo-inositol-1(or 4)-monophosphatase